MKKLYGIGTGPGASDLITVRSARLIENADVIFAPNNKGKNMALDTVREYIKTENIIFLDFPMGKVGPEIYKKNLEIIHENLSDNKSGVFITIGDAAIYSTFINTLYFDEEISFEMSPGIPSFLAAADFAGVPLTTKGKNFLLTDDIENANLEFVDRIAILKTYKNKKEVIEKLEAHNFSYIYLENVSAENELILREKEEILERENYMSLMIGWKNE